MLTWASIAFVALVRMEVKWKVNKAVCTVQALKPLRADPTAASSESSWKDAGYKALPRQDTQQLTRYQGFEFCHAFRGQGVMEVLCW